MWFPMDFPWFSWISHVSSWILMDFHRFFFDFSSIFIDLACNIPCKKIWFAIFHWFSMIFMDFPWFFMNFYGFSSIFHHFLCSSKDHVEGFSWFFLDFLRFFWDFMWFSIDFPWFSWISYDFSCGVQLKGFFFWSLSEHYFFSFDFPGIFWDFLVFLSIS